MGAFEFVGIGHLSVDRRDGARTLGGAVAYGCLTAHRLGLATALVTAFAEADGDLLAPLDGIRIERRPSERSTSFENRYAAGRREQRLLGRAAPLDETDIAKARALAGATAASFYGPIAREIEAPFASLAPKGLVGVAPQGFYRDWDAEGRVVRVDWPEAARRLAEADVVSVSHEDVPSVARLRAAVGDRLLAVTLGADGATLFLRERAYSLPAYPTTEVEPTGAGDVFAAALLVALREGRAPLDAAAFATCAASFAVEAVGLLGVPEDRARVEERLADYRRRFDAEEIG